jgi:hypothetical protein
MVVRRGFCTLTPPPDLVSDFNKFFDSAKDCFTSIFIDGPRSTGDLDMDSYGIHLWIYNSVKNEIVWYDYIWDDTENNLSKVIFEINFLIKDPNIDCFIVMVGGLTQNYDDGVLDVFVGNTSANQLSILGRGRHGEYSKSTYNLVKDSSSDRNFLEEV